MKIFCSLLIIIILSSCASQTKPAFFYSYHNNTNPESRETQQLRIPETGSVSELETLNYEKVNSLGEFNLQQAGRPVLVASTNNAVVENFREIESVASRKIYYDQPKESKQSKNLVTKFQQKKVINKNSRATTGGDPKKNKFANAGFITAFLSFLWPVAIVSITLSIIGLKSERKKQAITAIVIAVIFGLIGLLLAAAFAGI